MIRAISTLVLSLVGLLMQLGLLFVCIFKKHMRGKMFSFLAVTLASGAGLSLLNILQACIVLSGMDIPNGWCQAQAFMNQFFAALSVMSLVASTYNPTMILLFEMPPMNTQLWRTTHFVNVFVAFLTASAHLFDYPFSAYKLTPAAFMCDYDPLGRNGWAYFTILYSCVGQVCIFMHILAVTWLMFRKITAVQQERIFSAEMKRSKLIQWKLARKGFFLAMSVLVSLLPRAFLYIYVCATLQVPSPVFYHLAESCVYCGCILNPMAFYFTDDHFKASSTRLASSSLPSEPITATVIDSVKPSDT